MKIQYKASSIMIVFGVVIVLFLSAGYDFLSHKTIITKELQNIENISDEIALHLDSLLKEFAFSGISLSSAPIIKKSLLQSNLELSVLSEQQRKQEIERLNQQWITTKDINDVFIQAYMSNPVADFLLQQQRNLPGRYGEIFLTNRYGTIIATTGKLTTLAHAHKYWWQASFDDAKSRAFLDDRGFDTSVNDYVLGIVIPIKYNNEIIGILKCNVKILGPLSDVVRSFSQRHEGKLQIVRTGGLVVAEEGVAPLSSQVNGVLLSLLQKKENGTSIQRFNNEKQLLAFSAIDITMGSEEFGFGGSQESVDHIKGNRGEGWQVIVSLSEEQAIEMGHHARLLIILYGVIFTLLTAAVALLLGKLASKPIVELAMTAKILGKGDLDKRALVYSNDEIGSLAESINKMAKNIQLTILARDELIDEVKLRTIALEKAKKEAEVANHAKSVFINNMSHEFRTPLNAILGFSQEMLEDHTIADKHKDYLHIIKRSGHLQLELINDVIAMSDLDETTIIELRTFDLSQLLGDIVGRANKRARIKNLMFTIVLQTELPKTIQSDREKLQQSLNYVIDNAVKYTASGEIKLTIDCQPSDDPSDELSDDKESLLLTFDIKDSGIGIPVEYHTRIFQPFVQLGEQHDKTGTGLGLTLSQRFLALIGGTISLDSEPGKGSTFHIIVPIKALTNAYFGQNELPDNAFDAMKQADSTENDLALIRRNLYTLQDELLTELAHAVFLLDVEHALEIAARIESNAPELAQALITRINHFDFKNLQGLLKSYHDKWMS